MKITRALLERMAREEIEKVKENYSGVRPGIPDESQPDDREMSVEEFIKSLKMAAARTGYSSVAGFLEDLNNRLSNLEG